MKQILLALALVAPAASAQVTLVRSSVTPIGTAASQGSLTLCGSAGEAQAGTTSSFGSLVLVSGFWAGLDKNYIPCPADITTTNTNPGDGNYGRPDGTVDGADLSYFVENWLGGNAQVADVQTTNTNPGEAGYGQPDGQVDGADLSYFVEQWLAGCP